MKKAVLDIYNSIADGTLTKIKFSKDVKKKAKKVANGQYVIFLSVSSDKNRAKVIKGLGKSLEKALQDAFEKLQRSNEELAKIKYVKLDIVTRIRQLNEDKKAFNILNDTISYNRGLDGIAFGENFDTAFLPSEITGYNIIKSKKIYINFAFRALKNQIPSTLSSFFKPIDENGEIEAYKFRTRTYFTDGQTVHQLYRGHRLYDEVTEKELLYAIGLSKDNYFKNVVNKKGKFIYSFLPHENKREKRYNILRHAGTIYSMLEIYELMPDEKLLKEAKRAFKFLFDTIKPLQINDREVKVVVEKDAQKIGGNALAIIALAKYYDVTGDTSYINLMQDLAEWIKQVQADNGEFTVHKQKYSTGERFDFISHYYPGEAILGLVRLYQIDKNEKWLDVAEKAANYLINIRDKAATIDTIAHDHWLLYGLNELYRERQKEMYLKHSFFIAEAMMKTQISEDDAKRKELIGGYRPKSGNEPRSTPVACRSEGLGAAYRLARDFGHNEIAERMKYAIHQGIKFQLQMQLRSESVMHYKRKKLCLGAMQSGLKSYALRIDYTQHNISSFISYYNILKLKN